MSIPIINLGIKMFKKKLVVAALLSLATTVSMAQAQTKKDDGFYAELGYAQAYYTEPGANFNHAMGVLKGGYNINKYIAAEVMVAGNLNDAVFYSGSTRIVASVSNAYGAYGKFSLPVNEDFSLFARVGVTNARVDATATNGSRSASAWSSGSDFSYGGGAQFNFTKNIYGQVDYMSYYDKNGITVSAPSISVGYKF